jgi:hypothetical protein
MYEVIKKNKTYKKRKLIIYDDNDKKIAEVTPWGGWFCWSNKLDKNFSIIRMEVLKNLYWLLGHDSDEEEWIRSIERWDSGKGIYGVPLATGQTIHPTQFHNIDEKYSALESFNNA